MAIDNAPKTRQREQLVRKQSRRASYDRILIVSEGSKTEPLYFREIRAHYRLHAANVAVQPSALGTDPKTIVQYAQDLFLRGDRHKNIQPRKFEQVYAVFDRDQHQGYFDALDLAKSLDGKLHNDLRQPVKFAAIASVPCFELWLLLHYQDIHAPLHRHELVQRLKLHMPDYDKGKSGVFAATCEHLDVATQRARRLAQRHSAYSDPEPYTAIVDLVALLIGLRGHDDGG